MVWLWAAPIAAPAAARLQAGRPVFHATGKTRQAAARPAAVRATPIHRKVRQRTAAESAPAAAVVARARLCRPMRSLPGSRLLHYDILGPLGAGAMGEVYRARDSKLEREVAIKVLPAHFAADAERLKRFGREATTLASLNHPNVAQIFGVEAVDGLCFLVLELVPGESLEDRLKRGPLPIAEAIEVCRQIAEGLEAAHEAGVIHRDLKPANVRLTPDGKVKVLDFGLAKPAR
jgi:serine/threonine protein kinase